MIAAHLASTLYTERNPKRPRRRSVNLLPGPHSLLSFARVRININPWHLRSLCFHTLTHSSALPKTLSPIVSYCSTLFQRNTQEGVSPSQASANNPSRDPSDFNFKRLAPFTLSLEGSVVEGSTFNCFSPNSHRIIFFTHPHPLSPIESYSCRNKGRLKPGPTQLYGGWPTRRFYVWGF